MGEVNKVALFMLSVLLGFLAALVLLIVIAATARAVTDLMNGNVTPAVWGAAAFWGFVIGLIIYVAEED